jgi:hypothetical protein
MQARMSSRTRLRQLQSSCHPIRGVHSIREYCCNGIGEGQVIEAATQRLELSRKHALDAYGLAETTRGEPAFRLGLRAGTDTTQSAHALAGRGSRSIALPAVSSPWSSDRVIAAVRARPHGPLVRRTASAFGPPVPPPATAVAHAAASAVRAQALNRRCVRCARRLAVTPRRSWITA